MPFNADSNARKIVWRRLREARDIKARIASGDAYEWETKRLENLVREAKLYARLARTMKTKTNPVSLPLQPTRKGPPRYDHYTPKAPARSA
jgi:hypothetical protein